MSLSSLLDSLCMNLTGQPGIVVLHQLQAIYYNLISWFLVLIGMRKSVLTLERKPIAQVTNGSAARDGSDASAVLVLSPGGYERLVLGALDSSSLVTVGYNVTSEQVDRVPGCASLAVLPRSRPPAGTAVVRVAAFSVNYADVTIRWGLYESAIRFVGYPIVPGFDFSGVVEAVGDGVSNVAVGDEVMTKTLPLHKPHARPRPHTGDGYLILRCVLLARPRAVWAAPAHPAAALHLRGCRAVLCRWHCPPLTPGRRPLATAAIRLIEPRRARALGGRRRRIDAAANGEDRRL